jgi:hypothetical protein
VALELGELVAQQRQRRAARGRAPGWPTRPAAACRCGARPGCARRRAPARRRATAPSTSACSCCASGVATSRPLTRSNSAKPTCRSACASTLLAAGCDTCSNSAAPLTPPVSITARNTSIWRRFMGELNPRLWARQLFSFDRAGGRAHDGGNAPRGDPMETAMHSSHVGAAAPPRPAAAAALAAARPASRARRSFPPARAHRAAATARRRGRPAGAHARPTGSRRAGSSPWCWRTSRAAAW